MQHAARWQPVQAQIVLNRATCLGLESDIHGNAIGAGDLELDDALQVDRQRDQEMSIVRQHALHQLAERSVTFASGKSDRNASFRSASSCSDRTAIFSSRNEGKS
jgi:hypothetical protein